MNDKLKTSSVDLFANALLNLKDKNECLEFLEDICTINEISFSQRFEVAKMLKDKKTYTEIAKATGASTATISRVNRSLIYGNGSYNKLFDRIDNLS